MAAATMTTATVNTVPTTAPMMRFVDESLLASKALFKESIKFEMACIWGSATTTAAEDDGVDRDDGADISETIGCGEPDETGSEGLTSFNCTKPPPGSTESIRETPTCTKLFESITGAAYIKNSLSVRGMNCAHLSLALMRGPLYTEWQL